MEQVGGRGRISTKQTGAHETVTQGNDRAPLATSGLYEVEPEFVASRESKTRSR